MNPVDIFIRFGIQVVAVHHTKSTGWRNIAQAGTGGMADIFRLGLPFGFIQVSDVIENRELEV